MNSSGRDITPALPQPGKIWTVDEANRRLDELRELLPQMRAWMIRLSQIHDELQRLARFWGKELESKDHPDLPLKERLDTEWAALRRRLEQEVGRLAEEGIEVKDLDTGLVDFYGYVDHELVLLCWKRDEESVAFFHTLTGGFRSRKPIPESNPPTRLSRAASRPPP
jgi:hypothetical protein